MSRDSCDNTIAKFSLLFGKWFFSSKRYTTWADNIFLSRILEEEEEEHLPVVRRDLVLDESVDERADPLFTQALSKTRLTIFPPPNIVLSNLDIKRETSFLQWREPSACLRPDLCVTSVTKFGLQLCEGEQTSPKGGANHICATCRFVRESPAGKSECAVD